MLAFINLLLTVTIIIIDKKFLHIRLTHKYINATSMNKNQYCLTKAYWHWNELNQLSVMLRYWYLSIVDIPVVTVSYGVAIATANTDSRSYSFSIRLFISYENQQVYKFIK